MFNASKLAIQLDRDGEEPIYRQLIRHIRAQIESGVLQAGTRLPASRDLAQQLNISRISVVNAYAELRAEGFLSAHAGRGTFIAGDNHGGNGQAHTYTAPSSNNAADVPSAPDRSIRDMMRMARKPGVISFANGAPPNDFFPITHVRDAINTVLERDGAQALAYELPEGYQPLRLAIRDYVSGLGIRCHPEQVLVTGGTQQALDLVVQALLSEGDLLVTENPTYLGMIDIARTRRVQIHGIDVDQDGIRLDLLENFILETRPKLIYVMPTFHNPTGAVMPLHRRRQLINLAAEHRIPILEDGVYHELRFEGESLPPLKALDENGIVIHASAFTKMMLPGMRIGYIISDSAHYERLLRVKQAADISSPSLNQRTMHLLLERGVMSQQLMWNNRELKRRRDVALVAAHKYLPPGTRWNRPQGGLYLWAQFPTNGPTATEVYITAIQMGAAYAIGNVFYTNNCGNHRIRLNYAAHKPFDIEEGFKRIGRAWRDVACEYDEMEKLPLL